MASFSSRGGPAKPLGVSKPDITAPGVQILAGAAPDHVGLPGGPQGELFQAIAGTSMSSPHIAGSGALVKALHPSWTPGQIKSALMTTAQTAGLVKEDGTTPFDAFDAGSGRVNLNVAGDPGLTFDATGNQYLAAEDHLYTANYPSIYHPTMPGLITLSRTAPKVLRRRVECDPRPHRARVDFKIKVKKLGSRSRPARTRLSRSSSTPPRWRSARRASGPSRSPRPGGRPSVLTSVEYDRPAARRTWKLIKEWCSLIELRRQY